MTEFCGDAVVQAPSCDPAGGSAKKRVVGYYEAWSQQRNCDQSELYAIYDFIRGLTCSFSSVSQWHSARSLDTSKLRLSIHRSDQLHCGAYGCQRCELVQKLYKFEARQLWSWNMGLCRWLEHERSGLDESYILWARGRCRRTGCIRSVNHCLHGWVWIWRCWYWLGKIYQIQIHSPKYWRLS